MRLACNQSAVNPTCQLFNRAEETIEQFILHCDTLDLVRTPIIQEISSELNQNHTVVLNFMNCQKILSFTGYSAADNIGLCNLDE